MYRTKYVFIFIFVSVVILIFGSGYTILTPVTEEAGLPRTILSNPSTVAKTYSVHSIEDMPGESDQIIFKDRVLNEIEKQGLPTMSERVNEIITPKFEIIVSSTTMSEAIVAESTEELDIASTTIQENLITI